MMMKKALMIFAVLCLGACQMNDGGIGDYFGSWLLHSMTVDGTEDPEFDPETTFWEFQNNIIEISQVSRLYEKTGRWGTWSEEDGKLLLDFTHHENGIEPGSAHYQAPEWLHFTPNEILSLDFVSRSSKNMTLSWSDPEGRKIVYSLRKIW